MSWLRPLDRTLRLSRAGCVVLVVTPTLPALCTLARHVAREHPDAVFLESVADLDAVEAGSVVVLLVRSAELAALNLRRSVIDDRQLRLVLWTRPALAHRLAHRAPDAFSWVTARIDGPDEPPAHGVAALRAAAGQVVGWRGAPLEAALRAAWPDARWRRVARLADATRCPSEAGDPCQRPWLVIDRPTAWLHPQDLEPLRRSGRWSGIIVDAGPEPSYWYPEIDATLMEPAFAALLLSAAGIRDAVAVAVLAGLEPLAIDACATGFRFGSVADCLRALPHVRDPGATAAQMSRRGWSLTTDGSLNRMALLHRRAPAQLVLPLALSPGIARRLRLTSQSERVFELWLRWAHPETADRSTAPAVTDDPPDLPLIPPAVRRAGLALVSLQGGRTTTVIASARHILAEMGAEDAERPDTRTARAHRLLWSHLLAAALAVEGQPVGARAVLAAALDSPNDTPSSPQSSDALAAMETILWFDWARLLLLGAWPADAWAAALAGHRCAGGEPIGHVGWQLLEEAATLAGAPAIAARARIMGRPGGMPSRTALDDG